MSLVVLLCDEEDKNNAILTDDYITEDKLIIETIRNTSITSKRQLFRYIETIIFKENSCKGESKCYTGHSRDDRAFLKNMYLCFW